MKTYIFLFTISLVAVNASAANWYTTAISQDKSESSYVDLDSIKIYNGFSLKPIEMDFNKDIYIKYSQKIRTEDFILIKDIFTSCKYWIYGSTSQRIYNLKGAFKASKTPEFVMGNVPTGSFDGITADHACTIAASKDFQSNERGAIDNLELLKDRFPNHYKALID